MEKSERPDHNLKQVESFVSRLDVLDYGQKAASHYGDIRTDLERRATIGVNDLHIAGHARSEGLTLITNNLREFERVDGYGRKVWRKNIDGFSGLENKKARELPLLLFSCGAQSAPHLA